MQIKKRAFGTWFIRILFHGVKSLRTTKYTYGFLSLFVVDKAMAFVSLNPAATASSNHLRNCKTKKEEGLSYLIRKHDNQAASE